MDEEPGLEAYVATLVEARWRVAAFVAASLAIGAAYLVTATPLYESDVLVQVEERSKGLLGPLEEIPGLLGNQTPAETEIEILRSRTLLGSVVDQLRLDVVARPRYLPFVGRAIARWRMSDETRPWHAGPFAWGGERIELPRLEVPPGLLGKRLTLTARANGEFEVTGPGGLRFRGEVGKPAASEPDRKGARVELFVAELVAADGGQFELERLHRSEAVRGLQRALSITEQGRKTGVLRVALAGSSPERIAATLDAIASTYVRQNVERRSAEAEKTLEFVSSQLPVLKSNVEAAEAALGEYRARRGSAMDLSLETKAILDRASEVEKRATELAFQRAELQQRFTDGHPAVAALKRKESALTAERAVTDEQIRLLPRAELDLVRLMRDAKVANELYVLLLNKSQELKVMKSGTIGNVRVLDAAMVPIEPTSPRAVGALGGALLFGLALGVTFAFVRKLLDVAVEDPEQIERHLGLSVYASVPHADAQVALARKRDGHQLLAVQHPDDLAVESLRSLRTSLQFALVESGNARIAVTGPSPGVGKSFVVANLGHVVAEMGKRVLVIDCDLRKGRLHHYFGLQRGLGLSDVICGASPLDAALRATCVPNLTLLTAGKIPPNPAEMLASERFRETIDAAAARFDLLLLDTPPVLAVTDAMLVAVEAGLTLLVLRDHRHSIREIRATIARMSQGGASPHAIVLNGVRPSAGKYGGYHYHYAYK